MRLTAGCIYRFVWIAYTVIYLHFEWQTCRKKSHRNKHWHTHSLSLYIHTCNRAHFSTQIVKRLWTISCLRRLFYARTTLNKSVCFESLCIPIHQVLIWACWKSWGWASVKFLMKWQDICHGGHLYENVLVLWYCKQSLDLEEMYQQKTYFKLCCTALCI